MLLELFLCDVLRSSQRKLKNRARRGHAHHQQHRTSHFCSLQRPFRRFLTDTALYTVTPLYRIAQWNEIPLDCTEETLDTPSSITPAFCDLITASVTSVSSLRRHNHSKIAHSQKKENESLHHVGSGGSVCHQSPYCRNC